MTTVSSDNGRAAPDVAAFQQAVDQARTGLMAGGVPIGAALTVRGRVVAVGRNERVQSGDPIAHGEMSCLRNAGRLTSYRHSALYTTLAPCAMCAGAIVQFKIPSVIVGEDQSFSGELNWLRSRGVSVEVLNDRECIDMMATFVRAEPQLWAEDIGDQTD